MTVIRMNTYDERHSFRFVSSMIKNVTGFTKLLLDVIYVYIFRESQKTMPKSDEPPSQSFHSLERKRGASRQRGQQGNRKQGLVRSRHISHAGHVEIGRAFLMYWMLPIYKRPCCESNIHCSYFKNPESCLYYFCNQLRHKHVVCFLR